MANEWLNRMQELLVYNFNQQNAINAHARAVSMGIDPTPYKHPYPGSTNNTFQFIVPPEPKPEPPPSPVASVAPVATVASAAGKRLWPWLLGTVAGSGILAAGMSGAAYLLSRGPSVVTNIIEPPAATAPVTPPATGPTNPAALFPGLELRVYERDGDDGEWQLTTKTVEEVLKAKKGKP